MPLTFMQVTCSTDPNHRLTRATDIPPPKPFKTRERISSLSALTILHLINVEVNQPSRFPSRMCF